MRITINDKATFNVTQREYTDEGFLRVPGYVARTGIQEYLASELGLTDRDPNAIVKVYRPPEEVFKDESLDSYAGADVTDNHPPQFVNSETYKSTSVGVVRGAGVRDGDFVKTDIIIKDQAAIQKAESGKSQLSAGYSAEYEPTDFDSVGYHFTQRDIKVNHVALVDRARAGYQARLFDSRINDGVAKMHKITLDSGRVVEIEDGAQAALINDTLDRANQKVKDAETKVDQMQATLDSAQEENEALKAQVSDEAIAKRVAVIASTMDAARKLAGKDFTCDSVDPVTIQRAALTASNSKRDWADKSDAYIQAAFDQATEEMENEDEDEEDKKEKAANDAQLSRIASDSARPAKTTADIAAESRQSAVNMFTDGWKKTAGE